MLLIFFSFLIDTKNFFALNLVKPIHFGRTCTTHHLILVENFSIWSVPGPTDLQRRHPLHQRHRHRAQVRVHEEMLLTDRRRYSHFWRAFSTPECVPCWARTDRGSQNSTHDIKGSQPRLNSAKHSFRIARHHHRLEPALQVDVLHRERDWGEQRPATDRFQSVSPQAGAVLRRVGGGGLRKPPGQDQTPQTRRPRAELHNDGVFVFYHDHHRGVPLYHVGQASNAHPHGADAVVVRSGCKRNHWTIWSI